MNQMVQVRDRFAPILTGAMLVAALVLPQFAVAQSDKAASDKQAAEKQGGEKAPAVKVERRAGGRKVYRITTGFVIEGRIQKPNAFYVLQRSQINYDWAQLDKNFVPGILESVKENPF